MSRLREAGHRIRAAVWPVDRLAAWVAFLALPVALLFLLQVRRFSLQNGVDPFIYLGYQQDTPDLVDRYGWQYFAVRFGLLWPGHFATVLFGIVPGYFVLRLALALLALGSLILLGRSWGSRLSGWAAGVACLVSPVFIAAVMTIYADTVGLPCLIAGSALLLGKGRAAGWRALLAGLFFGVAFNANFFVLLPLLGGFGLRALLQASRREWRRFADYLLVGVGVLVVTAVGAVGYQLIYGTFDVLGPSLDAARKYSGDGGLVFRQNNHEWLRISPHLYIPPLVALGLLAAVLTRPARPAETTWRRWTQPGASDAFVVLLGVLVAYGLQQFVLDGYSVETYYYYSYAFAFTCVGLVMLFVELAERGGRVAVIAAGAAAVAAPLARNIAFGGLEIWVLPWVPLLAALVLGLMLATRWWPRLSSVAAVSVAVVVGALAFAPPSNVPLKPGMSFRVEPRYETMLGDANPEGIRIYQAAAEVAAVVPKWKRDPGSNIYWYDSQSPLLNAAQATQYWRTVALQELGKGHPRLSDAQARQLQMRTPRHLVILSETARDLALRTTRVEHVVEPLSVRKKVVGPAGTRVYVAVLTFSPSPCDIDYRGEAPWLELPPCP